MQVKSVVSPDPHTQQPRSPPPSSSQQPPRGLETGLLTLAYLCFSGFSFFFPCNNPTVFFTEVRIIFHLENDKISPTLRTERAFCLFQGS